MPIGTVTFKCPNNSKFFQINPFLSLYVEARHFLFLTAVCDVRIYIQLHRKKWNVMLLLSSELRESVAEMERKGSKMKCRFVQIKAFIQLIFFDMKLPLLV